MTSSFVGSAFDETMFVASEANPVDLPKKNPGTAKEVSASYFRTWRDLGFSTHLCEGDNCGDSAPSDIDDSAQKVEDSFPGYRTVVFTRDGVWTKPAEAGRSTSSTPDSSPQASPGRREDLHCSEDNKNTGTPPDFRTAGADVTYRHSLKASRM
jgi:hypothetical protein